MIFFEEGSPQVHVRRALREAHNLRKLLIQQEQETTPARVGGRELSGLRTNRMRARRVD